MTDLLDLRSALADAEAALDRAAALAHQVSGNVPGREPGEWTERYRCLACDGIGMVPPHFEDGRRRSVVPIVDCYRCLDCNGVGHYTTTHSDPGEPASPGWPAMVALSDRLTDLLMQLRAAIGPEVKEAITASQRDVDEGPEVIAAGDDRYYETRREATQ